jgi:hypothetical protein
VNKSEWIIQSQKALNGNILITGSIGSGKTQGTILPYFDQILSNFTPEPSVLAIDPKGTFVEKALKIIEKRGLSDRILHLRLGGNVTFNPIFEKDALKESRFLSIAQMVRAAAANFDSQSGRCDAFWENSSYNLIKSSLIYCAAVHEYYTLKDLYSVMVRAGEDEIYQTLEAVAKDEKFGEEEVANIGFALEYFTREYSQLETKVRTSILATATSFLNQFQEYQANRLFCPKKEGVTLASMREAIDQGKILLFDIRNNALARSMGTFVKLHFEQALLNRLADPQANRERAGVLLVDEYQDVVTVGSGGTLGDGAFLAKGREGNTITIAATQSLTSLENAVGREKAARELIQNFRTRIVCHSSDPSTIRNFQELVGQVDRPKRSHSISEQAHHTKRNLVLGGFEAKDANISESISHTEQKEYVVTTGDFSRLNSFEAFALVYDGVGTTFRKLFLKPHYLEKKNTPHLEVLKSLKVVAAMFLAVITTTVHAFPSVCSVAKTDEFKSCMDLNIGVCMCGWPTPHPCAKFDYYIPQTFVEVMPDPGSSYFGSLPGAAIQLAGMSKLPFGHESDTDSQSFQAHTINVPLAMIPYSLLPCEGVRIDRFCFDGMSEHLGENWKTGTADSLQPQFLAWSLSPKACLLKGAAMSLTGGSTGTPHPGSPMCSVPMSWVPKYPPSSHEACNGWGTFYPRYGTYHGPSQTVGALMIASRMKSLSSEIFNSTPTSPDEKWQMISPQSSSCFREGQNVGLLELMKNVRELGRLTNGKLKGHLFVVWSKVSCCKEFSEVAVTYAAIEAMILACKGMGGL